MKTFFKSMGIAVAILAVVAGGIFLLKNTGVIDRAAANMNRADQVAETPGPDTIPAGTWTVGKDAQAGTYQTRQAVAAGAGCYWAIYRSGSNQRDIVANELLDAGGRPTVTLEIGQDFSSHDCGVWEKVK